MTLKHFLRFITSNKQI